MRTWLLVLWSLVTASSACSKKERAPHRTEPWLANPSASSHAPAGAAQSFHFLGESRIRFLVPGRKAKLSGEVPVLSGKLRLNPHELSHSSASLDADLTRLSIDSASLPEALDLGGSSASSVAQFWLELGPDVAPERRQQLSRAHFELTSLEGLSASSFGVETTQARGQVRATAVGTLLLHGYRAPVRVALVLAPVKTSPGAPQRISIRSSSALVLPLAPHDIAARGPSGIADPLQTARAAEWVGKAARIEFELLAEAEPAVAK